MLTIPKARELVALLSDSSRPFVCLVGCHRQSKTEVVIIEVEVERGQRTVYPINRDERLAVAFDQADEIPPSVLALRKDFPQVPHLNIAPFERPKASVSTRSLTVTSRIAGPLPDLSHGLGNGWP